MTNSSPTVASTAPRPDELGRAILDALEDHAALLAADGTILAVNQAWHDFAAANTPAGADPSAAGSLGAGANYLSVCAAAGASDRAHPLGNGRPAAAREDAGRASSAEDARAFGAGLQSVLESRQDRFVYEYPCHSPAAQRWFLARISRLPAGLRLAGAEVVALVVHENVTRRRLIENELEILRRMSDQAGHGAAAQSPDGRPLSLADPPAFRALADQYHEIVGRSVEQREYKVQHEISNRIHALGDQLGALRAGPRDLIDLHRLAFHRVERQVSHTRLPVMLEEGRLVLLELMGRLALFYRSLTSGAPRAASPQSGSGGSPGSADHPAARRATSLFGPRVRGIVMNKYLIKLYVAGQTWRSQRAIANLRQICENELAGEYDLVVIDVLERPQLAEDEKILATPTVVKELPTPIRRIIGDLSDSERVLLGLDLQRVAQPPREALEPSPGTRPASVPEPSGAAPASE